MEVLLFPLLWHSPFAINIFDKHQGLHYFIWICLVVVQFLANKHIVRMS